MEGERQRGRSRTATVRPAVARVLERIRRERSAQVVAGAVVVGFVLRLAWVLVAARPPAGEHDPTFYETLARGLAAGRGYVGPTGEPTAYYPPGYPAALSVVVWLVLNTPLPDDVPMAGALLNLIVGTASIALVGLIGWRLVEPRVGAIASVLVALTPSLVIYTGVLLTETVFIGVELLALAVLLWHPWHGARAGEAASPGLGRLAVAGLLFGAALLVRPTFAPALVLLPVALWLAWRDPRRWLLGTAVLLAAAGLVVVPWTVRNLVQLDAFVPISTNTGDNLCIGNHPDAPGSFALPDYCFADLPPFDPPASEVEQNRLLTDRALRWMREHPGEQPSLVAWRTYFTFLNDHEAIRATTSYGDDPWLSPRRIEALQFASDLVYFPLLVLGLLGSVAFGAGRSPRRLALLLVIVGIAIAPWPFFGEPRFHVPLLPLLAVPAAFPLAALPEIRRRFAPPS